MKLIWKIFYIRTTLKILTSCLAERRARIICKRLGRIYREYFKLLLVASERPSQVRIYYFLYLLQVAYSPLYSFIKGNIVYGYLRPLEPSSFLLESQKTNLKSWKTQFAPFHASEWTPGALFLIIRVTLLLPTSEYRLIICSPSLTFRWLSALALGLLRQLAQLITSSSAGRMHSRTLEVLICLRSLDI